MLESKCVLVLIPARGGSKGIPRKNIQGLSGHPLIWRSIQAALVSAYVDDCFVSTDDKEIAKVARACGAWVPFLRPAELAQDGSKTIDCMEEGLACLAEMGRRYDIVVLLQAQAHFARQPTSTVHSSASRSAASAVWSQSARWTSRPSSCARWPPTARSRTRWPRTAWCAARTCPRTARSTGPPTSTAPRRFVPIRALTTTRSAGCSTARGRSALTSRPTSRRPGRSSPSAWHATAHLRCRSWPCLGNTCGPGRAPTKCPMLTTFMTIPDTASKSAR